MIKIGVIGTGMLGSALLATLSQVRQEMQLDLCCWNRSVEKGQAVATDTGVHYCRGMEELCRNCQVIFVTVSLTSIKDVTGVIELYAPAESVIVSSDPRTSLTQLSQMMKTHRYLIRFMANTNLISGGSPIVYCHEDAFEQSSLAESVRQVFRALGKTIFIREELMSCYTGMVGCAAMLMYVALEAGQDAAVCSGIPLADATLALTEVWKGAMERISQCPAQLTQIKHELYYPGGITIKGVCELEAKGFRDAVICGIQAMIEK
jgi:pyrroline-5-carboxylate reductase